MAVAGTTGLSNSETDQSSVYSYDRDAEYDDQMQTRSSDRDLEMPTESDGDVGDREEVTESDSTFPSLSSTYNSLRFLLKYDDISVTSLTRCQFPFFHMTPIRRTGEVEIQIETVSTECYLNLKDIEIGLERSAQCPAGLESAYDEKFHNIPLYECSCIFSLYGALFNSLKRKAFVNISYSQNRFALLQDINRIGLKITREGALEFFVNGQNLGIAAEEVYKLGLKKITGTYTGGELCVHTGLPTFRPKQPVSYCLAMNYYPILWLPLGGSVNKATLIAGGKYYKKKNFWQLHTKIILLLIMVL